MLIHIFVLLCCIAGASARNNKVRLSFAQIGFASPTDGGNDEVAARTSLHIDLTKFGSGPWYENQCFELKFKANYRDPDAALAYNSFLPDAIPDCTALERFSIFCKVKDGTNDTIQFYMTNMDPQVVKSKKIDFLVSNFNNPFSRVLVYSTLYWYSDMQCSKDVSDLDGSKLNLRIAPIDPSSATFTSTSDTVGTSTPENAFKLQFQPGAPIAPNKKGTIDIRMPDWYNIDNGAKRGQMFSELAIDTCNSTHLNITSSQYRVDNLRIKFDGIFDPYTINSVIDLTCSGFRNPIYPAIWTGFSLTLYDSMSIGENN